MSWEDRVDDYWASVNLDVGWNPADMATGNYEPPGLPPGHVRATPWKPLTAVFPSEGRSAPEVVWVACYRREEHDLEKLAAVTEEAKGTDVLQLLRELIRRLK